MKTATTHYRLAAALTVASALFLVQGAGALGILGEGGRPDRVYAVVLGVLVLGSVGARFKARGMAMILAATAATQVLVTVVALLAELPPEGASVVDIVGINAMYAALFGLSSWLFWRAAEQPNPVSAGQQA